jgi:hypothetical protein
MQGDLGLHLRPCLQLPWPLSLRPGNADVGTHPHLLVWPQHLMALAWDHEQGGGVLAAMMSTQRTDSPAQQK